MAKRKMVDPQELPGRSCGHPPTMQRQFTHIITAAPPSLCIADPGLEFELQEKRMLKRKSQLQRILER